MSFETFVVVEANERFGFARIKPDGGEELLHCELYPDSGEAPAALQLRPGDHVRGVRHGQSVGQLSWISRRPPPPELVQRLAELSKTLAERGFTSLPPPETLAERSWRKARDAGDFERELDLRLPPFFAEEAHPFEDAHLLDRAVEKMKPLVPQAAIQPVAGQPLFRVEPGGQEAPAHPSSREEPSPTFRPLVDALNALLARADAPARWVQVRGNWRLGPPDLVTLLIRHGVIASAMLN